MIKLTSNGGGDISAFQWTTSEQVWPFEKSNSGATLYCKQFNFGAMSGFSGNISLDIGFTLTDWITQIHRLELFKGYTGGGGVGHMVDENSTYCAVYVPTNVIYVAWNNDQNGYTAFARVIYSK